ncbi:Peroxisomal membrane signal receptor PTS1 [Tulasnella sp. UAMH 9824]|nr:Peroxisomal membrane signal receptor PTS1 [Tulasnella sp. UAMH 9824]
MSFNALVSGADCGPVNALSQMVKHTEADRSLQKDRVGPSASGSRLQHLPTTTAGAPNAADVAMARQFFDGQATAPMPLQHGLPFAAPVMRAPIDAMQRGASPRLGTPVETGNAALQDAWARGAAPAPNALAEAWNRGGSSSQAPVAADLGQVRLGAPSMPLGMGMYGGFAGPRMMPMYSSLNAVQTSHQPQLDWDQEFSKVSEADVKGKGKAKADLDDLEERFKALVARDEAQRLAETEGHPDYMRDFEKIWNQSLHAPSKDMEEIAKWESDYQQVLQAHREEIEGLRHADFDYGADIQRAWEQRYGRGLTSDMTEKADEDRPFFDPLGIPNLPEYAFEQNNPNLAAPQGTLLAKAKEYLANNGSLSEAALMLEAAIQKGELGEGGYETWILLGETRSMDEREDLGLLALRQGVKIAKEAGVVGPGMLSLAVSYTNESYETAANNILRDWLLAKYPDAPMVQIKSPWHAREVITNAFLSVAQRLHAEGKSDPDVQVGLGILYYTENAYDKAKDCFESAVWARPDDYLLWNRLGSCLSNGSKPEEALNVYREALRLRPTYTRAIFNVGVACLNIGAYKEAAEHFLSALSSQRTSSGGVPPPDLNANRSEQLWKTLRKAFEAMNREDLVDLTNKGDVEVFRSHGFDF